MTQRTVFILGAGLSALATTLIATHLAHPTPERAEQVSRRSAPSSSRPGRDAERARLDAMQEDILALADAVGELIERPDPASNTSDDAASRAEPPPPQERVASLDDRLSREPRTGDGQAAASALVDAIAIRLGDAAPLDDVVCGRTLCRVDVHLDEPMVGSPLLQELVFSVPWQAEGFLYQSIEESRVSFYLSREGYALTERSSG